jgi:hypothetical protein
MPSIEEKQHRKAIQNRLEKEASVGILANLPMPKEKLTVYFNYLDQRLAEHECDNTLRLTEQFATDQKLSYDLIKQWLSKYGGYCDCEVLANVEEKFEGL